MRDRVQGLKNDTALKKLKLWFETLYTSVLLMHFNSIQSQWFIDTQAAPATQAYQKSFLAKLHKS